MIGLDKLKRGIGITALVLLLWVGLSTAAYFTWVRGADHRVFYRAGLLSKSLLLLIKQGTKNSGSNYCERVPRRVIAIGK